MSMSVDERLALAQRRGDEVEVFHLGMSRYLKQYGDGQEQYVPAAPSAQVRVVLLSKIERPVWDPAPTPKNPGAMRVARNEDGTVKTKIVPQPEDAFLKREKLAEPVDVRPNVKKSKVKSAAEMVQKV